MIDQHGADSAQDLAYSAAPPPLDIEKYRHYVDDYDITEERKIELLETLWTIVYTFVRAGFGLDSVRRCLPALEDLSSEADSDALRKSDQQDERSAAFNDAAADGKDE